MLVTRDTSHFEMSPLNRGRSVEILTKIEYLREVELLNNQVMSATSDTSQYPIGPCGPSEQLLESLAHESMAPLSSDLDLGANTVVADLDFGANTVVESMCCVGTTHVTSRIAL